MLNVAKLTSTFQRRLSSWIIGLMARSPAVSLASLLASSQSTASSSYRSFTENLSSKTDWTLKSWEAIKGPYLWKRGPVPPKPEGHTGEVVQDYYRGHVKAIELSRNIGAVPGDSIEDTEKGNTKDAPDPIIGSASPEHSDSAKPVSQRTPSLT